MPFVIYVPLEIFSKKFDNDNWLMLSKHSQIFTHQFCPPAPAQHRNGNRISNMFVWLTNKFRLKTRENKCHVHTVVAKAKISSHLVHQMLSKTHETSMNSRSPLIFYREKKLQMFYFALFRHIATLWPKWKRHNAKTAIYLMIYHELIKLLWMNSTLEWVPWRFRHFSHSNWVAHFFGRVRNSENIKTNSVKVLIIGIELMMGCNRSKWKASKVNMNRRGTWNQFARSATFQQTRTKTRTRTRISE